MCCIIDLDSHTELMPPRIIVVFNLCPYHDTIIEADNCYTCLPRSVALEHLSHAVLMTSRLSFRRIIIS